VIYLLDTNAISDLMRADARIENWISALDRGDRVVTCTIVRGEILFGIARLPEGRRRAELEDAGLQFLNAFRCEPIPQLSPHLGGQTPGPCSATGAVLAV
jgi:predicted nucleic acid-binding protein